MLLIGAGDAASMLLHEINRNPSDEMNIICAVDDSPQKVGRTISACKIMGTTARFPELVERCEIETILLCIPTIEETRQAPHSVDLLQDQLQSADHAGSSSS